MPLMLEPRKNTIIYQFGKTTIGTKASGRCDSQSQGPWRIGLCHWSNEGLSASSVGVVSKYPLSYKEALELMVNYVIDRKNNQADNLLNHVAS